MARGAAEGHSKNRSRSGAIYRESTTGMDQFIIVNMRRSLKYGLRKGRYVHYIVVCELAVAQLDVEGTGPRTRMQVFSPALSIASISAAVAIKDVRV